MTTLIISYEEIVEPLSDKFTKSLQSIFETAQEKYRLDSSVELVFITDEFMKRLNAKFRQKDGTTDVLSFDLGVSMVPFEETASKEIYISVEQAFRQATELGVSTTEEIRRLFLHGLLHLCGWEHNTEAELIAMEKETESIINLVGSPVNL